jgi:hypothetical protein
MTPDQANEFVRQIITSATPAIQNYNKRIWNAMQRAALRRVPYAKGCE